MRTEWHFIFCGTGCGTHFITRYKLYINQELKPLSGGEGGIRTRDRVAPVPPFQGGDLNRSSTSPCKCGQDFTLRGDSLLEKLRRTGRLRRSLRDQYGEHQPRIIGQPDARAPPARSGWPWTHGPATRPHAAEPDAIERSPPHQPVRDGGLQR